MATKYTRSIPSVDNRYKAHALKDIHFPGSEPFDKLEEVLEEVESLYYKLRGTRDDDELIAVHLIPQEREAYIDEMLSSGRTHTIALDIVNFTITLLFSNSRPFTFFCEVPFKDGDDNWYGEAQAAFISQASNFLLRKAERRGYKVGRYQKEQGE